MSRFCLLCDVWLPGALVGFRFLCDEPQPNIHYSLRSLDACETGETDAIRAKKKEKNVEKHFVLPLKLYNSPKRARKGLLDNVADKVN